MIGVLPRVATDAMKVGSEEFGPLLETLYAQVDREREQAKPWEPMMRDLRAMGAWLEVWATDQDGTYPTASQWPALLEDMREIGSPKKIPSRDTWGNPYAYAVSPDGNHYRLVSAGADGVFEWDSRQAASVKKDTKTHYTDRLEDDIIFGDGQFVQVPKVAEKLAKE